MPKTTLASLEERVAKLEDILKKGKKERSGSPEDISDKDMDRLEPLLEDLEADLDDFTEWEQDFIKSIREKRYDVDRNLSKPQAETLEKIHGKYYE